MTQQEIMQHPFWGMMQNRIGVVINGLVQRGMIQPSESQHLINLLKGSGNELLNFVNGLIMRYQEINQNQMDSEIMRFIEAPLNVVRQRMRSMMNGGGFCAPGFGGGFGGSGFGGGGFSQPSGFGYDPGFGGMRQNNCMPGVPTSPFSGNPVPNKDVFSAPGAGIASMFGGTPKQPTERDKVVAAEMNKKVAAPPSTPVSWKEPNLVEEKTYNIGAVNMMCSKYELYDGSVARSIIVHDPVVGYTSDQDVIAKYKPIFEVLPEAKRKVLTISYRQLKVMRVGRDEFMRMATAISTAVSKNSDVPGKLRAIIASLGDYNLHAVEEFTKLFLDELDLHIQCGELCDSFHPKNILNRPSKIDDVLSWVTGDVSKDMLNAMQGMKGFTERLEQLLSFIIDSIIKELPKLIINTVTDMTMLDDFYRALPGVWTDDCGSTLKGTEDLVNLFLATRETIDGSKTENASKADSTLKLTLTNLSKQFTMVFLPRVTTWCNYAKSDICRYDESGNCQPSCWAPLQPRGDVEFFIGDVLKKWQASRDIKIKWSPKSIYMNVDEETFYLQYGMTTNDCNWTGQTKYWH